MRGSDIYIYILYMCVCMCVKYCSFCSQSQWQCRLRCRSAAARLLRLWVRIHRGHGCLCVVRFVCCQVEVSVTSWSLTQSNSTDCGAALCVIYWVPAPLEAVAPKTNKKSFRQLLKTRNLTARYNSELRFSVPKYLFFRFVNKWIHFRFWRVTPWCGGLIFVLETTLIYVVKSRSVA
jgi:hypothetical protein